MDIPIWVPCTFLIGGLILSLLVAAADSVIPVFAVHQRTGSQPHPLNRSLELWLESPQSFALGIAAWKCIGGTFAVVGAYILLSSHLGISVFGAIIGVVAMIVLLTAGEVAVRGFVFIRAEELGPLLAPVVRAMMWGASPLIAPSRLVFRVFQWGFGERFGGPYWTPQEWSRLATEVESEELGRDSGELLRSMIEFSDTVIREIMVPRTSMIALSLDATMEEVREITLNVGHSRIPVYDETIDNICGLLHVKRLFAAELEARQRDGEPSLANLLRPTFFVPEVMKISELLREFQRRKTHMAIVVDEYGGTAGVVTLEDIIEEIVGEIQDEYDVDEKQFRLVSETKIIADGRVNLFDLGDSIGVEFPDDGQYETLAGFITDRAGYLPEAGTSVQWENLTFVVREADSRRIALVELESDRAFEVNDSPRL